MKGSDPVTWDDLLAMAILAAIGAIAGGIIGWVGAKVFA